jgi:hypothetical protein
MKILRGDISTWNKTADILYSTQDYKVAQEVLRVELKFYKREYNRKRIRGRIKRLYATALTNNKELISDIKPARIKDINYILGGETLLRAYLKFKKDITQGLLYSLLKYEFIHKNRFLIKQTIVAQIVKGENHGIR